MYTESKRAVPVEHFKYVSDITFQKIDTFLMFPDTSPTV